MNLFVSQLILIILYLFYQTYSFATLQTIACITGTSPYTIYDASISNSGQLIYMSVKEKDGVTHMKMYNISTGAPVLKKIFTDKNSSIIPNQIFLYSGGYYSGGYYSGGYYSTGYVVGIQSTNLSFSVFYTNSTYVGRCSVNQLVQQFIQSGSQNIVLFLTTTGKVAWVTVNDFPAGNYKTTIMAGLIGTLKGFISPNHNYLVVGTSGTNYVYLIQLVGKHLVHNFSLDGNDTRSIAWKNDSSKIFVASKHSGTIKQFSITSPYTNTATYTYASANQCTVSSLIYLSATNQLVIYSYKSNKSEVVIYSFMLSNSTLFHTEKYNYTINIIGSKFDNSNSFYYLEWSSNILYAKKLISTCSVGSYFDQCLDKCNVCTASCTNCTSAGCGTCAVNATNNTTNSTNTTTYNNTASNVTAYNATLDNSTIDDNTTNITIYQDTQNQYFVICKHFSSLLNNTLKLDFLSALNKVPGGRKLLKPIFTFFGNFDDLWLYNYHPRNYQFIISSTLQSVQNLQNQKWSLINYQTIWNFVGLNTSELKIIYNTKAQFSEPKYFQVEGNQNGFFLNTINFFLSNMLLTIMLFLVCRFFFFLFFRYRISIFFRQFSFWPYLILILMDGNLQIASYLIAFDLKWLFCKSLLQKGLTVWMLVIFFFLLVFSIGAYFLFKFMYGQLARYFFDNSKYSNIGAFYMMAQVGLRNIVLGFLHLMITDSYSVKIAAIFFVEFSFFCFGVIIVKQNTIFQFKIKAWINLIATFLRLFVIGTFYFEQNQVDGQITNTSIIFLHVIGLYIFLAAISIFYEITKLVLQFFGFLQNNTLSKFIMQHEAHDQGSQIKWNNRIGQLKNILIILYLIFQKSNQFNLRFQVFNQINYFLF